jgi:uncharacterized protein YndB with AHSA1/START domain
VSVRPARRRTDGASRIIKAAPQAIYQAFLDPEAVATWRPPKGMTARIVAFAAREGGGYRMVFVYSDVNHATRSADASSSSLQMRASWSASNSNPMIRRSPVR